MIRARRHRIVVVLAFLAVVATLATAVWRLSFMQGLDQLEARGEADLALASDRLVGQLQRYRDLAVLMADHPVVDELLQAGRGISGASDLLQRVADKTAALDVAVVDTEGRVIAASLSAPGRDMGRPRFLRRALNGALGWGHGDASPLTSRAFFHAAPVFAPEGAVQGAVVVTTDLRNIDYNWRGSTPATYFTDAKGVVLITNRSEMLFWRRGITGAPLAPPEAPAPAFEQRVVGGHELWRLGMGKYLPLEALHLTRALPVIGLTGEVLLDTAPLRRLAVAQAAAVAALCLAFGSLLYLAAERRQTLARANALLEARVAKRTAALHDTNQRLLREAAEREEAEKALRRAQADLVQAGKLSALGQMSAGISHELNQPLMAIRSFAENGQQFLDRGDAARAADNLGRIADLARRMGRIIQNLRAFARQDNMRQERVELGAVLRAAIELTETTLRDAGVTLIYAPPPEPLWVRGGEVRLGQVFVNLIANAADAMADSDERRLTVKMETEADRVVVLVQDTGPGIETPDKVFDPFYTTKGVGGTGGMGLGLSISYGIVQSFGGQIRGANTGMGAVFSVTLERTDPAAEAA